MEIVWKLFQRKKKQKKKLKFQTFFFGLTTTLWATLTISNHRCLKKNKSHSCCGFLMVLISFFYNRTRNVNLSMHNNTTSLWVLNSNWWLVLNSWSLLTHNFIQRAEPIPSQGAQAISVEGSKVIRSKNKG